jgi:hypothetical protein
MKKSVKSHREPGAECVVFVSMPNGFDCQLAP